MNLNWNYENPTQPMIHGRNLSQTSGSIIGKALLYFYGTTLTSGGTTGVSGPTTDTIKMYDLTRATPTSIYDNQTTGAVVHPNVIYKAWGDPDSTRAYFVGCSLEILLQVPLAINWNYFYVSLSNDIPALTWSAEFDRSTTFEIQRSYDGSNFSIINTVPSEAGRTEYKFNDDLVNANALVVYYRIKATQISGEEKYTQVKTIRFNNKPGTILMAPNPFTNNFIINYTTGERETITIKMFNGSGQLKLMKNVIVNNGNNSINITEAARFANGIYVLQVSGVNNKISTIKVIKH
jgi:hypothetical protein